MNILSRTFSLLALLALLATSASAQDVYIYVDVPVTNEVAKEMALGALGADMYDLQEGAHGAFTNASGETIDHYYIWVCFGDECLPFDPIRYNQ